MNLFDVLDNLDVLPKRAAGVVAAAAIVSIAWVPPIRHFYLDQARLRGEEISQTLMKAVTHPPAHRPNQKRSPNRATR